MNIDLNEAYLVAYGRSPIARARKGGLADVHPVTFGAATLKGVLARVPQLKAAVIDDVIVGCASTHDLQEGNFA
jgi:acetyl-CoA acyltransferase